MKIGPLKLQLNHLAGVLLVLPGILSQLLPPGALAPWLASLGPWGVIVGALVLAIAKSVVVPPGPGAGPTGGAAAGMFVLAFLCASCGATPVVVHAVGDEVNCVLTHALVPGATFESVALACSGVTIADVEAIVQTVLVLEAGGADAGVAPSKLGVALAKVHHQ